MAGFGGRRMYLVFGKRKKLVVLEGSSESQRRFSA